MDTKRQGFWLNYINKIVEMTKNLLRNDSMDAFLCLNKALLDFYRVKDDKGGKRR